MTTHLLVNGMIRCGQPPGHLAIEGQTWPRDLRVCAKVAYTDCPTCRKLGREGGLQPGPMMQAAAKATSGAMDSLINTAATPQHIVSPMEALVDALDQGVTLADLSKLTQKAMKAMMEAQKSP